MTTEQSRMWPIIAIITVTILLAIFFVGVFVYLCYRKYMNGEETLLVNTELTLSSDGLDNR